MKKIHLFTNLYPLYRKSLWDELMKSTLGEFHFYFSKKAKQQIQTVNVESSYNIEDQSRFNFIKNYYLGPYLFWQSSVLYHVIRAPKGTFIFLGEMTVISTWLAAIICRLKGHRLVFWGHGLYGNEPFIVKRIRLLFLILANHNLVYEQRAKKQLIKEGFMPESLSVVYNSINFYSQRAHFKKLLRSTQSKPFSNNDFTLLFVGRLTTKKRIDLLIAAALKLNETKKVNLLIIGDGPMRETLAFQAEPLVKKNRCIFYGACYDEKILSEMIYSADLTVSPGNVGLTAIHSLSYGTPVCTHSNFNNQMPEAEAIRDGENGCFFQQNSLSSLTKNIIRWMEMNPKPSKEQARAIVDQFYNPKWQQKIIERSL